MKKNKLIKQIVAFSMASTLTFTAIPALSVNSYSPFISTVFASQQYVEKEMFICTAPYLGAVGPDIKVISLDTTPVIINSRTLVPIRAVVENLECKVEWEDNTKTTTITKDNTVLKLTVGSSQMLVSTDDGASFISQTLDASPIIINSRTLLPLRAPLEALGFGVHYQASFRTDCITIYPTKQIAEEVDAWHDAMDLAGAEDERRMMEEHERKQKELEERSAFRQTVSDYLWAEDARTKGQYWTEEQMRAEILRYINIVRTDYYKYKPLTSVPTLDTVAQIRAEESMVLLSHTRPNGSNCFSLKGDYEWFKKPMWSGKHIAENLAGAYANETPASIVVRWYESPTGHGWIISEEKNKSVGIGYYREGTEARACAWYSEDE